MNKPLRRFGLALAAVGMFAPAAKAAPITVGKSQVGAQFTQMSVPVEAPFRQFSGDVDFDPRQPQKARAHLVVQTASFDLGQADYNEQICKPEWFDCKHFPQATFDAQGLAAVAGGRFQTNGVLTLKGRRRRIAVTLRVDSKAGDTVFDGQVPIPRKIFDIGGPDWSGVVDDQVLVKFHIVVAN